MRQFLMILLSSAALMMSVSDARAPPPAAFAKNIHACPVTKAMEEFDFNKFTGDWYVLEYLYPAETPMQDVSCVGFNFSPTGFGDIMTNSTFRFPAKTGHFYHLPMWSYFTKVTDAVWETLIGQNKFVHVIVDTDYANWAVFVQCSELAGSGEPVFHSTRVLSRVRKPSVGRWVEIGRALQKSQAGTDFRYPIDHDVCQELDRDDDGSGGNNDGK